MNSKTNNQNTTKTEPSAEDKALAELIRTKILDFVNGMKKLCNDNGLSFDISGWVEDPVDRGHNSEKFLTFTNSKSDVCSMLVNKIINISVMLKECVDTCSYNEVTRLCAMAENLIGHVCNKVMANLDKKMETDNKTKSKTKEK